MFTLRTLATLGLSILVLGGNAWATPQYRVLLQSRDDAAASNEVFIASYTSYSGLVNSPAAVGGDFSGIDIGPSYTVAGLTYDGQYRLALTTRADGAAGSELFIATYANLGALVASPAAVGGDFSGIDVGANYRIAGLAYDGQYRLALTTRTDAGAGSELFIATYDSFADLVNSLPAVGGDFSGIDIGANYRIAALAFEPDPRTPPNGVPEPAAAWLVLLGLGLLVQRRRSSRS